MILYVYASLLSIFTLFMYKYISLHLHKSTLPQAFIHQCKDPVSQCCSCCRMFYLCFQHNNGSSLWKMNYVAVTWTEKNKEIQSRLTFISVFDLGSITGESLHVMIVVRCALLKRNQKDRVSFIFQRFYLQYFMKGVVHYWFDITYLRMFIL